MTDLDAELVAHAQGRRPLTRPLLCGATTSHDPGPDGTCRDCRTVVAPSDQVCAPDVLIHAQPDEDQQ